MRAHPQMRMQTTQARTARLPMPSAPSAPPVPPSAVVAAPTPESGPDRRRGRAAPQTWQMAVIAEYRDSTDDRRARLRRRLVGRLQALTSCIPAERTIAADAAARRATAVVDGVMFRLCGRDLLVVRPCAHCGTGHFESSPIESRRDLGYTLAAWEPYHHDCEPADLADDTSW